MLIKSMPRNERPLEKAMRNGVKSLSNSENETLETAKKSSIMKMNVNQEE